jgi:signal transduction histidine kinase
MPYRQIDDPAKLRRVLEATLLLEADLDLDAVLRHVVDEARAMTNARYAALGVLDTEKEGLSDFLTSGLDAGAERAIGDRPTGKGVLGLLIAEPQVVRIPRLSDHEASVGLPPNHPPMTSFLGVPIQVRGEIYGILYLTDKQGWEEFTVDDESLVGALAVAAGIAIESARLHELVAESAVFAERDRMARDLHDTVIQRLFGVGLSLQGLVSGGTETDRSARLSAAIDDIDDTIREIRTTIYGLTMTDVHRGARAAVLGLADELRPSVGVPVRIGFEGAVDAAMTTSVLEQLLPTLREAVTNVGKHADASRVDVMVDVRRGRCLLEVSDDGRGFDPDVTVTGFGLANLRRRAEKLHGTCTVECPASGGTILRWTVPMP